MPKKKGFGWTKKRKAIQGPMRRLAGRTLADSASARGKIHPRVKSSASEVNPPPEKKRRMAHSTTLRNVPSPAKPKAPTLSAAGASAQRQGRQKRPTEAPTIEKHESPPKKQKVNAALGNAKRLAAQSGETSLQRASHDRVFVTNLDVKYNNKPLRLKNGNDHNVVKLHEHLRETAGASTSGNAVALSIGVILATGDEDATFVRVDAHDTYSSAQGKEGGRRLADNEKKKVLAWMNDKDQKHINSYNHSEQKMVLDMREKNWVSGYVDKILGETDRADIKALVFDIGSNPNTACSNCYTSIKKLFDERPNWGIPEHAPVIVRFSATNPFSGALTQWSNWREKHRSTATSINIADNGSVTLVEGTERRELDKTCIIEWVFS